MSIEQYIKERIETLREEQEEYNRYSREHLMRLAGIYELQAVLSKIEEIG